MAIATGAMQDFIRFAISVFDAEELAICTKKQEWAKTCEAAFDLLTPAALEIELLEERLKHEQEIKRIDTALAIVHADYNEKPRLMGMATVAFINLPEQQTVLKKMRSISTEGAKCLRQLQLLVAGHHVVQQEEEEMLPVEWTINEWEAAMGTHFSPLLLTTMFDLYCGEENIASNCVTVTARTSGRVEGYKGRETMLEVNNDELGKMPNLPDKFTNVCFSPDVNWTQFWNNLELDPDSDTEWGHTFANGIAKKEVYVYYLRQFAPINK